MIKFEMNAEEMKDLHNAKCSVVSVRKDLNSLFREDNPMNQSILRAENLLRNALERYYKAEKAHWDEWYAYVDRKKKELNIRHSYWSIKDIDFDKPHPWPEMKLVKTSGWEEVPGRAVLGPSTTWGELWQAADAALGACDDKHHVYIEDFYPSKDKGTLIVSCGS